MVSKDIISRVPKFIRAVTWIAMVGGALPAISGFADEGDHSHEGQIFAHPEKGGHVHGAHPECPLPKTALDVVRCAQANHPKAKRARLVGHVSEALPSVARQIPNPDLDVETGFGKESGAAKSNVQIGLLQPIEWGGKRSSRIGIAQATHEQASSDAKEAEASVIQETVLRLYRLRQVDEEKASVESTIDTLTKVISQQRARPTLGPEQQVSLSVYRMALADAKIRASEIFDEEREIEHFFHVSTGHSLPELRKVLPSSPKKWPEVSDNPQGKTTSPTLARAVADQKLALAELSGARAGSWPGLKIGPQFELEREGGASNQLFGFRLMMDLPIFSFNGAGREHANENLGRADKFVEFTRAEESHERAEQVRVYRSAVQALKDAPPVAEIEKEHKRNESLGARGLVSGSLLIESHRQRNDLTKSRNGRELKAIESLWNIYRFDGRIFEESI